MDNKIWEIISAKLRGEQLDVCEEEALEKWFNADSQNLDIYNKLGAFCKAGKVCSDVNIEKAYANVIGRVNLRRRKNLYNLLGSVAAVAASVVVGIFILLGRGGEDPVKFPATAMEFVPVQDSASIVVVMGRERVIIDENDSVSIKGGNLFASAVKGALICDTNSTQYSSEKNADAQMNAVSVPAGKDYKVVLPDGTEVWLNSETSLSFPSEFGTSRRCVRLEGEAYFKVKQSGEWPFIVETENMDVRVTGTSFDIKAYKGDDEIFATLVNGAVKVIPKNRPGTEVDLMPCEQYSMNVVSGRQVIREVDPYLYIAWTDEMFAFRNRRLDEIMKDLSRWYRIKYEFADDTVKGLRVSANVEKDKSAENIMEMLDKLNKISVVRKDGTYRISVDK